MKHNAIWDIVELNRKDFAITLFKKKMSTSNFKKLKGKKYVQIVKRFTFSSWLKSDLCPPNLSLNMLADRLV